MLYLTHFYFPDDDADTGFIVDEKRTCYNTFYPFKILSRHDFREIEFAPVTILYGGNGSGKTTALNVIAEKLQLSREAPFNRSSFFQDYVDMCRCERGTIPPTSRVIASDDVFDFMLNLRAVNQGIDMRREELFKDYLDTKFSDFHFRTMEDYERLKKVNHARRRTQSRYVRENLMENPREQSNGESAFFYFTQKIQENALYLLDEPENSLAPDRQTELANFIQDSARFFHCQFVIATHSPFLLALREAKIYDLDENPVIVRRWTELPAVRAWYDFFQSHAEEFEGVHG